MPNQAYNNIKTLHKVVTANYENMDDLLAAYLTAGCEILKLDVGIASSIVNEQYEVLAVSENDLGIEVGAIFPLADTYCRQVFEKKQTVCVEQAGQVEPFKSHPVYENLQLESYISTPIFVEGKLFGTINFSSQTVRQEPFSGSDREILELMATSLGAFIRMKEDRERIQAKDQALYASAKLAALGEMAGGIAHEINNPLSVIDLQSAKIKELIRAESFSSAGDVENSVEKIQLTVRRISNIVNGMRELLYEVDEKSFKKTNFEPILDKTLSLCREKIKSQGIALQLQVVSDQPVACHPTHVSQILLNLLANAIDAVQGQDAPWIEVNVRVQDSAVLCEVSNSGEPIKNDIQDKMFEPFFTTKEVGDGTGLGLSISKAIAVKHGGDLTYNEGAPHPSFVFMIPVETSEKPH